MTTKSKKIISFEELNLLLIAYWQQYNLVSENPVFEEVTPTGLVKFIVEAELKGVDELVEKLKDTPAVEIGKLVRELVNSKYAYGYPHGSKTGYFTLVNVKGHKWKFVYNADMPEGYTYISDVKAPVEEQVQEEGPVEQPQTGPILREYVLTLDDFKDYVSLYWNKQNGSTVFSSVGLVMSAQEMISSIASTEPENPKDNMVRLAILRLSFDGVESILTALAESSTTFKWPKGGKVVRLSKGSFHRWCWEDVTNQESGKGEEKSEDATPGNLYEMVSDSLNQLKSLSETVAIINKHEDGQERTIASIKQQIGTLSYQFEQLTAIVNALNHPGGFNKPRAHGDYYGGFYGYNSSYAPSSARQTSQETNQHEMTETKSKSVTIDFKGEGTVTVNLD